MIACSMILERVIALETLEFLRKNLKLINYFVVETRNQLECVWWPLTLKIGQGQRSRSSKKSDKIPFKEATAMWSLNFQTLKIRSRPKIKDIHDSGSVNEQYETKNHTHVLPKEGICQPSNIFYIKLHIYTRSLR
jgi:hypothetical protein